MDSARFGQVPNVQLSRDISVSYMTYECVYGIVDNKVGRWVFSQDSKCYDLIENPFTTVLRFYFFFTVKSDALF